MKCRFCGKDFRVRVSGHEEVTLECSKCVHSFKVPRNASLARVMEIYREVYPDEPSSDKQAARDLWAALLALMQAWGPEIPDDNPAKMAANAALEKYEDRK